jgi:hypothetical protein
MGGKAADETAGSEVIVAVEVTGKETDAATEAIGNVGAAIVEGSGKQVVVATEAIGKGGIVGAVNVKVGALTKDTSSAGVEAAGNGPVTSLVCSTILCEDAIASKTDFASAYQI